MADTEHPYRMTLNLSVIDHLGINLYSNIPAVISEAVANAWDADATTVEIGIDLNGQTISIADDGDGMDLQEINDKFLTVGYRRREAEPVITSRGRHVMGRKGIGKLSLFSIARTIEVQTAKPAGSSVERNGLTMRTEAIRTAAARNAPYYPDAIGAAHIRLGKGTRIELTDLTIRPTTATISNLRRRLARRFSIIGGQNDFAVSVDGSPIAITERAYFDKVQYLWSIGDVGEEYAKLATNAEKRGHIDGSLDPANGYMVRGWVGTFDERKNIEEGANTVPVLAWGKLLQEDILAESEAGGLYTKYLTGELEADFVDLNNKDDIVTSDRQRLKEDDPRVVLLLEWFRSTVLRQIENSWRDWRRDSALDRAQEIPAVKEWFDTLTGDEKRFAKQLFGKIGTLAMEEEGARRELYRHAILAFEKLRFRNALSKINELPEQPDFTVLEAVFSGIDEIEQAEYHQIARARLEVIRKFVGIVESERERVIQQFLFDHLWLLHPSWERASTNLRIEEAVTKEFEKIDAGLSEEERRGRIDIRYRTAAGKHIIIELKKYDVDINLFTLAEQLSKYRGALTKCLAERFPDESRNIEAIAILGQPPIGPGVTPEAIDDVLGAINARFMTYDTLIAEALKSYDEYLEADRRVGRISAILDRLDDLANPTADGDAEHGAPGG